ncbi:MAG: hypothetical protein EVA89_00695 [Sandaracinaceae bacterium]|nr:MAG: hypothetical protein EVA89_00695 [Sandaracinaceae bacterium]
MRAYSPSRLRGPAVLALLTVAGCDGSTVSPVDSGQPDTGQALLDSGLADTGLGDAGRPLPEADIFIVADVETSATTDNATLWWNGERRTLSTDDSQVRVVRVVDDSHVEVLGRQRSEWVVWTVDETTDTTRAAGFVEPVVDSGDSYFDQAFAHTTDGWLRAGRYRRGGRSSWILFWNGSEWLRHPESPTDEDQYEPGDIERFDGRTYIAMYERDGDIPASLWIDGTEVVALPVTGASSAVYALTSDDSRLYAFGTDGGTRVMWTGDGTTFERHEIVGGPSVGGYSSLAFHIEVQGGRVYVAYTGRVDDEETPIVWTANADGTDGALEMLSTPRCGGVSGLAVADGVPYVIGYADRPSSGSTQCGHDSALWIRGESQPSLELDSDYRATFLRDIEVVAR